MSDCWKVPWTDYLSMIAGIKDDAYSPHCFNMEDGMVVFRTKRERRLLEDVISWANDKVLPEREPVAGEPRKKKEKATSGREGPSIGQLILQHPTIITNLRTKNTDYLQGLCPLCAEVGKDSDENHFFIHETSGGYGCVSDCETSELTRTLVKIMSNAGILESDTSQKAQEDVSESPVPSTVYKERKKEEEKKDVSRFEPDIESPGSRLVKNTDHHTVEHILIDGNDTHEGWVYNRVETSKKTGKETINEIEVAEANVRSLWQAIVRHIMPSPVIGGSFEVAELWDTMNMDRTKQGEKYRRWNFPSDILILLGIIEKDGNTYTVRRAYR